MRRFVYVTSTVCAVLAVSSLVRADADGASKEIVAKALKGLGDDAKVAKLKAATWKGKGIVHTGGNEVNFTGDWSVGGPSQLKIDAKSDSFKLIRAVNGEKAWYIFNENAGEANEDQLAMIKQEAFVYWLSLVTPLHAKGLTLKPIGESKVNNRPADGVTVSRKNRTDVSLFFDKENGLLLKVETQAKDLQGNEFKQETFYSDYKLSDGIQRPSKVAIQKDGKPYIEMEISDFKALEKLDEKIFVQPKD